MKARKILPLMLVLFLGACSPRVLGTYTGAMNELFPEKVAGYVRTAAPPGVGVADSEIKPKDSYLAAYKPPTESCPLLITGLNFASAGEAGNALRQLAQKEAPDSLRDKNGKPVFKVTQGPKKKGSTTIGERFEVFGNGEHGAAIMRFWTNGSVLFFLRNASSPKDAEDLNQCKTIVQDFEDSFPH